MNVVHTNKAGMLLLISAMRNSEHSYYTVDAQWEGIRWVAQDYDGVWNGYEEQPEPPTIPFDMSMWAPDMDVEQISQSGLAEDWNTTLYKIEP